MLKSIILARGSYRDRLKGPGRTVKQEQEEISRNHVPRLFLGSDIESMMLLKARIVHIP